MKSKSLVSLIMAALLTAGMACAGVSAFAVADDTTLSVMQSTDETEGYSYTWDRNSGEGLAVDVYTTSDKAVILIDNKLLADILIDTDGDAESQVYIDVSALELLDDGENLIQLVTTEDSYDISITVTDNYTEYEEETGPADGVTEYDWDRSVGGDLLIETGSTATKFAVRCGTLVGSSLTNKSLSIEDGTVTIGSAFLSKLKNGTHTMRIILCDMRVKVTVNVTGEETVEEKTVAAEQTDYTWNRSDLIGISVKTNSDSNKVAIMKDGETFATSKSVGVYVTSGRVGITAKVLKQLEDGENSLTLVFDDGEVDINVTVTDNKNDPEEETELVVDETEFDWEKGSEEGIVIQSNSRSKTFSVKKGSLVWGTSLTNKSLSIEDGQISLGADFLEKLRKGENDLTIVLKEGSVDITVNVIDPDEEDTDDKKEITAEETYFVWDRSDYIGIAVKTNSKSMKVSVTKDGEEIFSSSDKGVYNTLGRVGITAKYLNMLEDGENELVLEFRDGELPITVNVTDRKNAQEIDKELTADQTDFVWDRGSTKSITVNTNSESENVAVRKSGRLSLISDENSISIENGSITLKPAYLETLSDGENKLTLILDDGKINVTVTVNGTQSGSSSSGSSNRPSSSSGFSGSGNSDITNFVPATGSASLVAEIFAIASLSAAISAVVSIKKKKKKNN